MVALEKQGEVASEGIQKKKGLLLWETSQDKTEGRRCTATAPTEGLFWFFQRSRRQGHRVRRSETELGTSKSGATGEQKQSRDESKTSQER